VEEHFDTKPDSNINNKALVRKRNHSPKKSLLEQEFGVNGTGRNEDVNSYEVCCCYY
jgi:hypothetical protein